MSFHPNPNDTLSIHGVTYRTAEHPAAPGLPPLPILSLDASDRLERAFAAAAVPLQVVRSRTGVPAAGRHNLLKLAGDLPSRYGVLLSRAQVRDLQNDPDKRHLLDEARRTVAGGAVLLLGCDPAGDDFCAWWSVLAPLFRGTAWFTVGDPLAPWPEGVICLETDLAAIGAALRAALPPTTVEKGVAPMPRFDPDNPPYTGIRKLLH